MKPTTYNELAAKGDVTTQLAVLTIGDLREFVNGYILHGHVIPRPDGCLARRGGPRDFHMEDEVERIEKELAALLAPTPDQGGAGSAGDGRCKS